MHSAAIQLSGARAIATFSATVFPAKATSENGPPTGFGVAPFLGCPFALAPARMHCRLDRKIKEFVAMALPPRVVGWLVPGVCGIAAEEAACKASSCWRTKAIGSGARTVLTTGSVRAITRCELSGSKLVRVDISAACIQFSVSSKATETLYLMDSWSFGQSGSGCPPRATQA